MKIQMHIEADGVNDLADLANMLAPFLNRESAPTLEVVKTPAPKNEDLVNNESLAKVRAAAEENKKAQEAAAAEGNAEKKSVEPDPEETPKPKRKRRTKAQIEADRKAAEEAEAAKAAEAEDDETSGFSLDDDEESEPAEDDEPEAVIEKEAEELKVKGDGPDLDDLVDAGKKYLSVTENPEAIREILAEFGHERLTKVPDKDIPAIIEKIEALPLIPAEQD